MKRKKYQNVKHITMVRYAQIEIYTESLLDKLRILKGQDTNYLTLLVGYNSYHELSLTCIFVKQNREST